MTNQAKIINILNAEHQITEEIDLGSRDKHVGNVNLSEVAPYPRDYYGRITVDPLKVTRLTEAGGSTSTANFPDLLRQGVKFDVFSGFNEKPTVYPQLCSVVPSNEMQEEYGDDSGIGTPPIVAEGEEYPEVAVSMDGGTIIKNHKRGYIIAVTEEIQKFDKWGKVRDLSTQMGRSMRMGREATVMGVLTNTANYGSTANDQEQSNQQTLTFSPTNLNLAMTILTTMKDTESGQYLQVRPDTLVIGPLLQRFAMSLLGSMQLNRVGQGADAAPEIYGGGTNNPFFGLVNRIVVDPLFGASYQWALLDTTRALKYQEVEPLQTLISGKSAMDESYMLRDTIKYRVRDWYGVGMRDQRFAFYSDSTSAPEAS